MSVVVDASVAALWYVPQAGSDDADRILGLEAELFAPDLLPIEVASVLLRHRRHGAMSDGEVASALHRLGRDVSTLRLDDLLAPAYEIAARHGGSLYDALYIGLAQRLRLPLVSQDETMRRVARLAKVQAWSAADAFQRLSAAAPE
jgi:predicted nucleic acid-binding protein